MLFQPVLYATEAIGIGVKLVREEGTPKWPAISICMIRTWARGTTWRMISVSSSFVGFSSSFFCHCCCPVSSNPQSISNRWGFVALGAHYFLPLFFVSIQITTLSLYSLCLFLLDFEVCFCILLLTFGMSRLMALLSESLYIF